MSDAGGERHASTVREEIDLADELDESEAHGESLPQEREVSQADCKNTSHEESVVGEGLQQSDGDGDQSDTEVPIAAAVVGRAEPGVGNVETQRNTESGQQSLNDAVLQEAVDSVQMPEMDPSAKQEEDNDMKEKTEVKRRQRKRSDRKRPIVKRGGLASRHAVPHNRQKCKPEKRWRPDVRTCASARRRDKQKGRHRQLSGKRRSRRQSTSCSGLSCSDADTFSVVSELSDDSSCRKDSRRRRSARVDERTEKRVVERKSRKVKKKPLLSDSCDSATSPSSFTSSQSSATARSPSRTFLGDVSEWGRIEVPGIYGPDCSTSNKASLSSGLEPRSAYPLERAWIPEDAYRSLAHNSAKYGALMSSSGLRYVGDDLPTRVAYQHLKALAGMAGKVQNVILHNKLVFEKRIVRQEKSLIGRALLAWCDYRDRRRIQRRRLTRAVRRIERGRLLRTFEGWLSRLDDRDMSACKLKKGLQLQRRGIVRRCFDGWAGVCAERKWKQRLQNMEREVLTVQQKLRYANARRVVYFTKLRQKRQLHAWLAVAVDKKRKIAKTTRANLHFRRTRSFGALSRWYAKAIRTTERDFFRAEYVRGRMQRRLKLARAKDRIGRIQVSFAFEAVRQNVRREKRKRALWATADHFAAPRRARRALQMWRMYRRTTSAASLEHTWKLRLMRALNASPRGASPTAVAAASKKLKAASIRPTPTSLHRLENVSFGRLIKRYKRFLADVQLDDSDDIVTAHCPNTGPLLGLLTATSPRVLLSRSDNPKRKCAYTLEAIEREEAGSDPAWVGIHSALANKMVHRMLTERMFPQFADVEQISSEVVYGKDKKSRADFMLSMAEGRRIYVEVKAVTYSETRSDVRVGLFPDTASTRAQKHLTELMAAMREGVESACVFVVLERRCAAVGPFVEKDPKFSALLKEAQAKGVRLIGVAVDLIFDDDGCDFVFERFLETQLDP